jgi:hypothetical protein
VGGTSLDSLEESSQLLSGSLAAEMESVFPNKVALKTNYNPLSNQCSTIIYLVASGEKTDGRMKCHVLPRLSSFKNRVSMPGFFP